MEHKDYLKDISEIKKIMNKSSRFMSLSGLSGILAGVYALVGAFFAYNTVEQLYYPVYGSRSPFNILTIKLLAIASVVMLLAIVTGIILTQQKAKKNGEHIWDPIARRLLINFLIPLGTGGILALILIKHGYLILFAPVTLIFYGLACISASKFSLGHIKYLGLANVILGLFSAYFLGYGLYFWALGFGVFHIIYGSIMYFVIERKQ